MSAGAEGKLSDLLRFILVETEGSERCKQDTPPKETKSHDVFITRQPPNIASATVL